MSNPAVVKLQKKTICGQHVWLDDNIGESIHIHIDSFRIDLTVKEFRQMYSDICDTLNTYTMVDGFDSHYINPIYMEVMLWKDLPKLRAVSYDDVALKDMLCPGEEGIKLLPESRCVKALEGDTLENDAERPSHYQNQTSKERLDVVYESIKEHGYPYNNEYIIMYGNDNIIYDGQHRASCLWKLKGEVSVPVMRLHFEDYAADTMVTPVWKRGKIYRELRAFYHDMKEPKNLYKRLKKYKKDKAEKKLTAMRNEYMSRYGDKAIEIQNIFNNK